MTYAPDLTEMIHDTTKIAVDIPESAATANISPLIFKNGISPPAIISITCNYLRIPMALLFVSLGWGLVGIWWCICLTSIMKGIIIFVWFLFIKRKTLDKMTINENNNIN